MRSTCAEYWGLRRHDLLELLVDNDVGIKYAEYCLLDELGHFGCSVNCSNETGVLATFRYIAPKRLTRRVSRGLAPADSLAQLDEFMSRATFLEPTMEELGFAAELEEWAAVEGLALDTGESQLFAIAACRTGKVLTGDKRAIASAESAFDKFSWLLPLRERVACLEQSFVALVESVGVSRIREVVCGSPDTDIALSLSFSCSSPTATTHVDDEGLRSYIDSLRTSAHRLLNVGYRLVV